MVVDPTWVLLWLILLIPGFLLGISIMIVLSESDNAALVILGGPIAMAVIVLFPTLVTMFVYAKSIMILENWFGTGNAFAGLLIATILTAIPFLISLILKSRD